MFSLFLIPGIVVSVSDTHIPVSSVSHVIVSCDLGSTYKLYYDLESLALGL